MARLIRNLAIVLVLILAVGYGAASALVWDKLTKVDGLCHPDWATNDPTHFTITEPPIDTAPYAMPAPEDVTFRAVTRPSRSAAGGSPPTTRRHRPSSSSTATPPANATPTSCCPRGCCTALGWRCC